ncbi:MAG TPA: amino acid ABC transporter permease [Candidatus Competibacteraceae bacterium]|nr:amino acid ABC transporter permease [Candidatus Competibacteraceae bacterium]
MSKPVETTRRQAVWNDPRLRAIVYQILVLGGVLLLGWYLVSNTLHRLEQQSIATGFGFLEKEAGFGISESLIAYTPADTYLRAFLVGVLNTFKVGLVGIVLATLIGTVIGIARLSSNWLIARLAAIYVEGLRNIPLLLQLFLWYSLINESLPGPRQALSPLPGVFMSNRGLYLPAPVWQADYGYVALALIVAVVLALLLVRWAHRRQDLTGQQVPLSLLVLGPVLGLPVLVFFVLGAPLQWSVPELKGFNFQGGLSLSPEYAALLTGLTLYTAAFIAEIVRSGIQAVAKGQSEAALSLGLPRSKVLRLVILPQALRVIVPPLTSQYLNLIKNSSLAVAIGYPDLVSIANTTLNQTGQAVEGIAMIMATYLTISLAIAAFMNWYNKRIAFKER